MSGKIYPSSSVKKYCVGSLHRFTQSPVQPLVSRYRHLCMCTPLLSFLSWIVTSTTFCTSMNYRALALIRLKVFEEAIMIDATQ